VKRENPNDTLRDGSPPVNDKSDLSDGEVGELTAFVSARYDRADGDLPDLPGHGRVAR